MVQALCWQNGTGPYPGSGSTKAKLAASPSFSPCATLPSCPVTFCCAVSRYLRSANLRDPRLRRWAVEPHQGVDRMAASNTLFTQNSFRPIKKSHRQCITVSTATTPRVHDPARRLRGAVVVRQGLSTDHAVGHQHSLMCPQEITVQIRS